MGNPHLYHHLNYLDISFQVKMKSEKGPEKHILWETRAAAAQDRRWLDRPWNCVTVAYQGNQPKQANYVPWCFPLFEEAVDTQMAIPLKSSSDLSILVAWYQLLDVVRQLKTEVHLHLYKPGISGGWYLLIYSYQTCSEYKTEP